MAVLKTISKQTIHVYICVHGIFFLILRRFWSGYYWHCMKLIEHRRKMYC